ncbi:hypothetical protein GCM10010232_03080 [Streptomyces amakusaensis]|uniref:Uncharacterized protein n=1 Tax=Streptomyces amakusaensis TaxID=67271 RepID=A0ABW0AK71_9ACTN
MSARTELLLRPGLPSPAAAHAHRAALLVLRDSLRTAHLDAYSDEPWPADVLPSYEHALSLAETAAPPGPRPAKRRDLGMGIDLDPRDDAHFTVLLDLAPHTISAEAHGDEGPLFSASDTGTALWIAVTPAQEALLGERLDALGIPRTVFTPHEGRGGRFWDRLLPWAGR